MYLSPHEINGGTKLYALLGSPVNHSLSPVIHNCAFRLLNINAVYLAFDVKDLKEAVNGLKTLNVQGFNVTVPYKESIVPLLDDISDEAKTIGSVNTVINQNGRWIGYNTDASGFSKTMEPYRSVIQDQSVLILGSGGSARAVMYALLKDYNAKEIFVYNRTRDRALKLIEAFNAIQSEVPLRFVPDPAIRDDTRLLINTTSVGLTARESLIPAGSFRQDMLAYDLIYEPSETRFLQDARFAGATGINGLDMLIEQAAAAFTLWTGLDMPVEEIKKNLAKRVDNQ